MSLSRNSHKIIVLATACLLCCIMTAAADPGRWECELSGPGWTLWLDHEAGWIDDEVFMPPVNVSRLPVNPPGCGWDLLPHVTDKEVEVPGTVEEHFWGANGNPVGIAGDYRGVSWWSKTFTLDNSLRSKNIILMFDSVNLRAEVFVNRKLVGYDVIGNTPFEVDATDAVIFGGENRLDVRVTDPVGNFDWNDNELFPWGKNRVPGVHGFGGITGRIFLRAADAVRIEDIYVQNKPGIKDVEVFITLSNSLAAELDGELSLVIHEWQKPSNVLWKKTVPLIVTPDGKDVSLYVRAQKAKAWNIDDPHLYEASISFVSDNGTMSDSMCRRFGFRWFRIGEKNGDKRFYLNGKRVFIFAAMSRGFWPKNGIFPTPEMARRDIQTARLLGYNTVKFHRAVGQHYVTEVCDEVGHFIFEEPGGYRCMPEPDETAKIWRREKLKRIIIRDRSCPSLIMFNFKNEAQKPPDDDDIANIRMVHALDPTRIVTYNSDRNRTISHTERLEKDPFKLHMKPFDDTLYYHGWWDQHHWIPYVGYIDDYYENPRFYLRGVVNQARAISRTDSLYRLEEDEIIFWGEEGAGGTMVSLGKIKNELERIGVTGWREREHIDYYDEYDRFLNESGFRSSFPTVGHLTMALGRNLHYYHGRALENVRMSNIADAYILNGWASGGTHSDIVDAYRNPTADPSILSYYAQPLYLAVKFRDKVLPSGSVPVADIFIINEANIRGKHTLEVELIDPDYTSVFSKNFTVSVAGGEEFGELLVEGIKLPVVTIPGYYKLKATLRSRKGIEATGCDDIFIVDYMTSPGISGTVAVIDTSGTVTAFLKESRDIVSGEFDPHTSKLDYIIIGEHDYNHVRSLGRHKGGRATDPILDKVASGAVLIVLNQADRWAQSLDTKALQYINTHHWRRNGRLFVGRSPFLDGLPQAQSMNWEYQVFYEGDIWGIGLGRLGVKTVVAVAAQHRKEILNALCVIPYGRGKIILSTLKLLPELSSGEPQSAVAKKLFLNLLEYSEGKWNQ